MSPATADGTERDPQRERLVLHGGADVVVVAPPAAGGEAVVPPVTVTVTEALIGPTPEEL
jgi:hypothetical protein